MFNWFRKSAAREPSKKSSLFSTENIPSTEFDPSIWSAYMKMSIQRTLETTNIKNPDGSAAAMDAAPARPKSGIGTFAMDAPSEGNPLSMSPAFEPQTNVPFSQLCWYAAQGFIGYQIMGIIAQHWFVDKACTMPARDAARHGWEITINGEDDVDADVIEKIKKLDKKYRIKQNCVELIRMKNIFGIRIALFDIDTNDEEFYSTPFNIDGVKKGSYSGITQIDPYWITPELNFQDAANPAAINFYEPTWWRINGRRIHRSHLVVCRSNEVIDILKPSYLWGGVSVPQKIAERVYAAERTANEAPMLAMTKRLYAQKMDITQAIANPEAFAARMNFLNAGRDNYGTLAIGLEDEVTQLETTLTDFDEVINGQFHIACAAAEVPYTRMMEDSPKGGLNSSGDYESDSYHERLETLQEMDMSPLLERHYELMMKSEGMSYEIEPAWNAVDSPNAKEQADINKIKADTGAVLVQSGAIDGTDERQRIISDKDSGYNGLDPIVPDGPGDRDAEHQRRDEEAEAANEPKDTDKKKN